MEYKAQVKLLLDVLPEVAREKNFALYGGTAINLFVRNMPRLSVDIDLLYLPIEDRETTETEINQTLSRIKNSIQKIDSSITIQHLEDKFKLIATRQRAGIKIEVNPQARGVLSKTELRSLCDKAQNEFDTFSEIDVVPLGQLYGGKICAALDRQHPRDLFDVKYLLENEGFDDNVRKGFVFSLVNTSRPMHEVLMPNLQDQRLAMKNEFDGMTDELFSYDEYEDVRNRLIETIHSQLTNEDREFIYSIKKLEPRWDIYDFRDFSGVKWKLKNLEKLKENKEKYQQQLDALKVKLKI